MSPTKYDHTCFFFVTLRVLRVFVVPAAIFVVPAET